MSEYHLNLKFSNACMQIACNFDAYSNGLRGDKNACIKDNEVVYHVQNSIR